MKYDVNTQDSGKARMRSAGMASLVGGGLGLMDGMREIWNVEGGGRANLGPGPACPVGFPLAAESVPVCPWGSSDVGGQGLWVKPSNKEHFPRNLSGLSGLQSGPEF